MKQHEYRRVEIAANALNAMTRIAGGEADRLVVRITPRQGDSIETDDFDAALDHLCGGPAKNRTIDGISGKPASIVAAEDTFSGDIICRLCHLARPDRMGDRWNLLSPRALTSLLRTREGWPEDKRPEGFIPTCAECQRELA